MKLIVKAENPRIGKCHNCQEEKQIVDFWYADVMIDDEGVFIPLAGGNYDFCQVCVYKLFAGWMKITFEEELETV